MNHYKIPLILTAIIFIILLVACGTHSAPTHDGNSVISSTSTFAPESASSSFDELRKAAGVVDTAENTVDMSRLSVKGGVLYRGDAPVDTSATELNLSGLDFDDWTFLSAFSELKVLHLSTSDSSAYTMLQHLAKLNTLTIENYPGENLENLDCCCSLEALIISTAPSLTDVSTLCELTSLKELTLIDIPNQLTTNNLTGWSDLTFLRLENVSISSLSFLSECPALERLVLHSISGVEDFSAISVLSELQELRIVFTNFSQLNVLNSLNRLTDLALIQIGDISLVPIADYGLPLERFLCNASEDEMAILKDAYPDCVFE